MCRSNYKRKILIVDGSNLLFQMFFGMPARITNEQGIGIWGVIGFVGALLKIIRRVGPTHVAVLFDGESENIRTQMDENYKANRPDYNEVPEEENPFSQLPFIYQALDCLGIAYAETTHCETDDWVAAYVKHYEKDSEIVVSSFDSDFFQLIRDNVTIFRYRGDNSVLCTPEYLLEKFGITPEQYAQFKSLTGDTADNIKGADKIGPKTASDLLQQFGTLEAMFAGSDEIVKKSVRESVVANKERILKNLELIRLLGNEELPLTEEQMRYRDNGLSTNRVLQEIGLK